MRDVVNAHIVIRDIIDGIQSPRLRSVWLIEIKIAYNHPAFLSERRILNSVCCDCCMYPSRSCL
jgi:hypothetical protein